MQQISKDQFLPVEREHLGTEKIVRPSVNFWADAWRRLRKNKLAMGGLIVLIVLTLMAIIAPYFTNHTYDFQDYSNLDKSPSKQFWFGTDEFGRDLWTRVWWGTRISLFIGVVAALVDLVIGVLYGGISAYFGGRVDDIMMRIMEVIYSIPYLLVTILLIMYLEPGITTIIIAYSITGWVGMARLVRGQILQIKEQEFVLAARTLGASPWRIILRHLIPNALGIIIVQITFVVPSAIFTEAFLSFLGLGIKAPLASLGALISDGISVLQFHAYRLIIPTIIFSLILMSCNLLGDGLRDALDPKLRK
ncbi:ABC transporter permease [Gorillibacterium timonense]|uniref:ABC transporter permease n=1 Tax=Gorillibacterium timonense TaxID=1689269 RepID=UPI00071CBDF7|nr:ABC transporter permease [Gorillibacterium timonense]